MRSLLVAALLTSLALCAPAQAATVAVGPEEVAIAGPPVTYAAAPGETNRLTVTSVRGDRDAAVFRDAGAPIAPGAGCSARADGSVLCRARALASVRVRLGDGDDRLDGSGFSDQSPRPSPDSDDHFFVFRANGGAGADVLTGADGDFVCMGGGTGDDVLRTAVSLARSPNEPCVAGGGPGDDRLVGGANEEAFAGGAGRDSIVAAGGTDSALGGAGVDEIVLGGGSDFGAGGRGADRVSGGAGTDTLAGSAGRDRLLGGPGGDFFRLDHRSPDGRDVVRGGPGHDAATLVCGRCRGSLNGRADDGARERGAKDNLLEIDSLRTVSSRFDSEDERRIGFGSGADVLVGDGGVNFLAGFRGPDVIVGRGGGDQLVGGTGADRLLAADGRYDLVLCGPGRDRAIVDRLDRVRGCERVQVRRRLTTVPDR